MALVDVVSANVAEALAAVKRHDDEVAHGCEDAACTAIVRAAAEGEDVSAAAKLLVPLLDNESFSRWCA